MLRKRKKFFKKWKLIFGAVILFFVLCISVEAFCGILVLFMCSTVSFVIARLAYHCVMKHKMEYKTAYKYYMEVRRRLFSMGYNVNSIFQDDEQFVISLNSTLVRMAYEKDSFTSIDIATAIMHRIVDVKDTEEFVYDVFLCVMDKLLAPRKYKVSYDENIFVIEAEVEAMKKADFEAYVNKIGIQNFVKILKIMHDAYVSIDNPYLSVLYECASR